MAADKIVIEAQNLVSVGAACTDDYRTVEMRLALGGELVACAVYNVIVNGERHVVQAIAPKLRCSASGSVERRSSDNETTITEEEAPIRSLAIQIVKSNTPQYVAVVLSGQGGGCTGPGGYFVERDHQTIRVTVTNLNYSTKGVACTLEYAIGETIIPLGHAFDPHTAYTLVMNGETRASFTTDGAALGEESGRREVKLVPSDAVDGGSEDPNNVVVVPVLTFVENHQDPDENLLGLFLASSVTISPDGNHIYVTSPFAGTVTVFSRDLTTGALAYVEVQKDGVDGVEGLAGAQSVVISPDGRNLYATGASSDAVVVFDRNLTTGALTFVEFHSEARSGVDGLSWLASVTISPDGEHIYVAGLSDGAVVVFSRNSTKGTLTFVEAKRRLDNVLSVTVSPDGKHLYAVGQRDDAVAVYNRNTRTGTLTFVEVHKGGAVGFGRASSVVVSPDGKHVYVAGQGDSVAAVYSRNSTTGALTLLDFYRGYQGGFSYATMVTFSPDGKYLYAAGRYPNVVGIYRRNPSTGAITYLEARIDGVEAVEGLAFSEMLMVSPDGKHIYAIGFDSVAVFSVLLPTDTEGD
jgi:6-phosphogluconolactonase (cycloisomerase 2 family)